MRKCESFSYFDLEPSERIELEEITKALGKPVEAWSFVPHPAVIEALQADEGSTRRDRYIITIDSMCAAAYFPIADMLRQARVNINSYFSGGWADFVINAYFSEREKETFISGTRTVLEKHAKPGMGDKDADDLITVFRVEKELILHRKGVQESMPGHAAIDAVMKDRARFEMLLRDYRSADSTRAFIGDEAALAAHLRQLFQDRVILGFNPVFEYAFCFETQIVPIIGFDRSTADLVRRVMANELLRKPVVELCSVQVQAAAEESEKIVRHIALCEYDFPGQRNTWRETLYGSRTDTHNTTNIYTYPLEGTLNETPWVLSDYPDRWNRALSYQDATSGIRLGKLSHSHADKNAPQIFLPISGLGAHGITLGRPASGKTNSDVVLTDEFVRRLHRVVVLDSTGGFANKLPQRLRDLASCPQIDSDQASNGTFVRSVLLRSRGLVIPEIDGTQWATLLPTLFSEVDRLPDASAGNTARAVDSLLLIEEANSIWGETSEERTARLNGLDSLLNKAYRKGWAVWVSTQFPQHLERDGDGGFGIVAQLKNRIVHQCGDPQAIRVLQNVVAGEAGAEEGKVFNSMLESLPQYCAVVFGVIGGEGDMRSLPAVPVAIRKAE